MAYERHETVAERLDRNFTEQLQELRICQAGVQILFAFLLTIPFQQRFTDITHAQKVIYLATMFATALSVVVFTAPVALHRTLFHRGIKDSIVAWTDRLIVIGLVALGLGILGGVTLVVDVLLTHRAALAVGAAVLALEVALWVALPLVTRRHALESPLARASEAPGACGHD